MQKSYQALGNLVREAREKRGLTQVELAEIAGVADKTIQNIENYRGNPRFNVLIQIIQTLNIPADLIFHPGESDPTDTVEFFISEFGKCDNHNRRFVSSMVRSLFDGLRKLKEHT